MNEYDEALDAVIAAAQTMDELLFVRWKLQCSMQIGPDYLAYVAPLRLAGATETHWWLCGITITEQMRQHVEHVLYRDLVRIARDVVGQPITLLLAEECC